jgi:hypothetical protein
MKRRFPITLAGHLAAILLGLAVAIGWPRRLGTTSTSWAVIILLVGTGNPPPKCWKNGRRENRSEKVKRRGAEHAAEDTEEE